MATYKVAQDVEAEDKLLGPFGFRQFIYLIIVAMAGILGYGLFNLFPPLVVLPLPIVVFFGALALPLRKDQPMETYLAALVSFYVKPRKRLWQPDGIESVIEITAPKNSEENRTKNFSGSEAGKRLSYLADLADTRGWAIRHSTAPLPGTSMVGDVYNEARATEDMLDEAGGIAQSFESLIDKADSDRRQQIVDQMHTPPEPQTPTPATPAPVMTTPQKTTADFTPPVQSMPTQQTPPQTAVAPAPVAPRAPAPTADPAPNIHYDPYPNSIHQAVIQPISAQPTPPPAAPKPVVEPPSAPAQQPPDKSTSDNTVSPDIMNLANNRDLSVETLAREAKRMQQKNDEVVISLR